MHMTTERAEILVNQMEWLKRWFDNSFKGIKPRNYFRDLADEVNRGNSLYQSAVLLLVNCGTTPDDQHALFMNLMTDAERSDFWADYSDELNESWKNCRHAHALSMFMRQLVEHHRYAPARARLGINAIEQEYHKHKNLSRALIETAIKLQVDDTVMYIIAAGVALRVDHTPPPSRTP
jgi:hypothetical protein